MLHKSEVRNVNKCLPLARAFTKNEVFVIRVSFYSHAFYFGLLHGVRKKYIFTVEVCSFRGEKYGSPSREEK